MPYTQPDGENLGRETVRHKGNPDNPLRRAGIRAMRAQRVKRIKITDPTRDDLRNAIMEAAGIDTADTLAPVAQAAMLWISGELAMARLPNGRRLMLKWQWVDGFNYAEVSF